VPISFGEALLQPTVLYAPITEALFLAGIRVRYAVNITGHGWRKLMRHRADFTYRIRQLPDVPAVLSFIQKEAGLDARTAYGTFNMGAGFAVYVAPERAQDVVDAAAARGLRAAIGGHVEAGPRSVELASLGVTYRGDELELG
jgi:phosphoribosylformylglycinamidine cyclo-ligase